MHYGWCLPEFGWPPSGFPAAASLFHTTSLVLESRDEDHFASWIRIKGEAIFEEEKKVFRVSLILIRIRNHGSVS